MRQMVFNKESLLQSVTIALVISMILWVMYYIIVSPNQVYIRIRLDDKASLGSEWRIVFMPIIMSFAYLVLSQAGKAGVMNMPYDEPLSPREVGHIAAKLNILIMIIFVVVIISMVSGQSWPVEAVAISMFLMIFFVTSCLMAIKMFR
ncbi:hypothetical protein GO986_17280 [Deinococcus sp. HMF7620]|uniref:Uncharacterized protein n=1 Tax=Deinococcus arboris TaxID=2682977 RepID=A0A7C9LP13_9DEIO|nr:hypothetical protein [Deinococcus arboris]MVN88497.1 hypothetical protein [Deinococcus arboris]